MELISLSNAMSKELKLGWPRAEASLKRCAALGIYFAVGGIALSFVFSLLNKKLGATVLTVGFVAGGFALLLASIGFVSESVRNVVAAKEYRFKAFLKNLIFLVAYALAAAGLIVLLVQILTGNLDLTSAIGREK